MSTVLVLEHEDLIGPDLRWPLRIARLGKADITLLVCVTEKNIRNMKDVDLSGTADQPEWADRIADRMRSVLDDYLGAEQWTDSFPAKPIIKKDDQKDSHIRLPRVRIQYRSPDRLVEDIKQLTPHPGHDMVLFVGSADAIRQEELSAIFKKALRSLDCTMGVVIPGKRREEGEMLVAAGRGTHGRNAINLAAALGADTGRSLTSLYVEPNIGPDAPAVGKRILDGLMRGTLADKGSANVKRQVVIHDDPVKGIVQVCREVPVELIVFGATRMGALGEIRSTSIPSKVLRSRPDATLVAVRNMVPLRNRLERWLQSLVQRYVPQLRREERTELLERIQSNAQWNFDFRLLIGLSTIIATLGLMDNSAAVIIGAMLVAPLMTPLLGLGLAIAQANQRLAKMTLKAVSLGFITAFLLAFVIGFLVTEFQVPTDEMNARDWPKMLDLIIAFVSGLAAAYASGRPGLMAALPGVAIAAALLPPVATSGLAMSIGDFDLAIGALLLFAVNMVAIIMAAALSVWGLGIRYAGKTKRLIRLIAMGLTTLTIIMLLTLTFIPPRLEPERHLVEAVEAVLTEDLRLRRIRLQGELGVKNLQVDLGGTKLPDILLREQLKTIVRKHLGKKAGVRLTFRYEVFVK
jgi:uncharacterized hydrophobic protein (TIGR00271 family)